MKQLTLLSIAIIACSLLVFPTIGLAATGQLDALKEGLDVSAGKAEIPTGDASQSLPSLLGQIINTVFGVLGSIVLAFTLLGGLLWMMAGGNEDKVKRAKGFINGGINGMLVIFLAYALVYVVLAALQAGADNS